MNYIVGLNKITLSNGCYLDFEYPIKKTLVVDGIIVILIAAPLKGIYNQNVFGITTTGDYLWRIKETELFFDSEDCPYVNIELNGNGELVLFNWCDTGMVVNSQSGTIERKWNSK